MEPILTVKKIGGRLIHESPEDGAKHQYPEVDIHDNDQIMVGSTYLKVNIEMPPPPPEPVRCQRCRKDVSIEMGPGWSGEYICEACRKKVEENPSDWIQKFLEAFLADQMKLQGKGELPRFDLPEEVD